MSDSAIKWLNKQYKTGCNHHWEYAGHGHNYSVFRCIRCGQTGEY
jgi:hypothetical protein